LLEYRFVNYLCYTLYIVQNLTICFSSNPNPKFPLRSVPFRPTWQYGITTFKTVRIYIYRVIHQVPSSLFFHNNPVNQVWFFKIWNISVSWGLMYFYLVKIQTSIFQISLFYCNLYSEWYVGNVDVIKSKFRKL